MLRSTDITTFNDSFPPPGESPWVVGRGPTTELSIAAYDASWHGHDSERFCNARSMSRFRPARRARPEPLPRSRYKNS